MAALKVFLIFLKLGLTSFGGPIAHLGYFHNEFVTRRKWVTDSVYADLVALCQLLPGPASSQIGISLGLSHAGYLGAIAAWVGFTLPSALALVALGISASHLDTWWGHGVLHGLKIAAVAIVAQAIWVMGVKLCADKTRAFVAVVASIIATSLPMEFGQLAAILFGAGIGWLLLGTSSEWPHETLRVRVNRKFGIVSLLTFFGLLSALPILSTVSHSHAIQVFSSFFRAGSFVFGGGHVVLPLLQSAVVNIGWVDSGTFMAGYGAAQAIPGPLFSFAAYLGAVSIIPPAGWLGAFIALIAIFLPSFLLLIGILPFWESLRTSAAIRSMMAGVNAAVVGILLAAFYQLVWSSAIFTTSDFNLAALAFVILTFWKAPSWSIVLLSAAGALILQKL